MISVTEIWKSGALFSPLPSIIFHESPCKTKYFLEYYFDSLESQFFPVI